MMKILPLVVALALAACAQTDTSTSSMDTADVPAILTGAMEVPPVQTTSTGRALILVADDGTVSGIVEAPGMDGATALIEDDADAAVPVVVMLMPVADGRWEVPANTRLTPAQMSHHKAGKLHANVRSKAHPKGEVRAQLKSKPAAGATSAATK
ncbi:CHRD domain protein [Variovorax sp. RA8]|nr:CHRD domain protein [Variovorax sp. RA8]